MIYSALYVLLAIFVAFIIIKAAIKAFKKVDVESKIESREDAASIYNKHSSKMTEESCFAAKEVKDKIKNFVDSDC